MAEDKGKKGKKKEENKKETNSKSVKKNKGPEEMTDEEFERAIYSELDSSTARTQKYIGVYTLTAEDSSFFDKDYECTRYPHNQGRTAEEVIEKGFYSKEEKEAITEDNMRLIDACVSKWEPKTDKDKRRYCKEDIVDCCYEGFTFALNTYKQNSSTAKFSSYAFDCMSNKCKDWIERANNKSHGAMVSFSESTSKGDNPDDIKVEDTLEDERATKDYEYSEKKIALQGFIKKIFAEMEERYALVISFLYGLGEYENQPHSEHDLAIWLEYSKSQTDTLIKESFEAFKVTLYSLGLIDETASLLGEYLSLSAQRVDECMEDARESYWESVERKTGGSSEGEKSN